MKAAIGLMAGAILLAGQTGIAGAAALKPSGKYVFTDVDNCEAKFTFTTESFKLANNNTDTGVHMINSVGNGGIGSSIGYITFTPKTATGGKVSLTLTQVTGGALRINNGGVNVKTTTETINGTYSFTADSFTITPSGQSALVFTAVYGSLNSSGAPTSVHLIRSHTSTETPNCVEAITATQ